MTNPLQQAKYDLYLAIFTTASQLYELRVWPEDPTEKTDGAAGFTGELTAMTRRLAFLAPAPVAAAASSVKDGARRFATVIEDLRMGTRPLQGVLVGPPNDRYDSAQREFGASIDQFAVLAREDIGITDDYLPLTPATEPGR